MEKRKSNQKTVTRKYTLIVNGLESNVEWVMANLEERLKGLNKYENFNINLEEVKESA
jgi:hypothetical protein